MKVTILSLSPRCARPTAEMLGGHTVERTVCLKESVVDEMSHLAIQDTFRFIYAAPGSRPEDVLEAVEVYPYLVFTGEGEHGFPLPPVDSLVFQAAKRLFDLGYRLKGWEVYERGLYYGLVRLEHWGEDGEVEEVAEWETGEHEPELLSWFSEALEEREGLSLGDDAENILRTLAILTKAHAED